MSDADRSRREIAATLREIAEKIERGALVARRFELNYEEPPDGGSVERVPIGEANLSLDLGPAALGIPSVVDEHVTPGRFKIIPPRH